MLLKAFALGLLVSFPAFAAVDLGMPCADSKVQSQRSRELQKIRAADQSDREWQIKGKRPDLKILEKMSRRDLARRKRVGEIFGEGCLKTADDFEAAFLVYQHGNASDHFYQAFLWAKRSMELGRAGIKGDLAMAVDRYLVSIGHKQLFGTQASLPTVGGCWCIQPTEESFPPALREEYRGGANAAYTGPEYLKTLNAGKNCPATFCPSELKASPRGSLPGFW